MILIKILKIRHLFLLLILTALIYCDSATKHQLKFVDLDEEAVVNSDSVTVSFQITPKNWREKGYKIHVLLDRNHFRELRDELSVTYKNLTEGAHAIFAFLCDKNGVSLKTPQSVGVRNFYSKNVTNPLIDQNAPMLMINNPQKEIFRGDEGLRILFDFLILNADLGDKYQVHYNLDGLDFYIQNENPIWIEDARRIGEHKLEVRLETFDGKLVDSNPFNSITKRFLVAEK